MSDLNLNPDQALAFITWLGHRNHSELFAKPKHFRPGKENYQWNKQHRAWPVTAYAEDPQRALVFAIRHARTSMVCVGLNDRPRPLVNDRGYPTSTKEDGIELSRNLFLDIDFTEKPPKESQLRDLESYLTTEGFAWYRDMGFRAPEFGFSGQGYQLHSGYAPVYVAETPDIADRLRKFSLEFQTDHDKALEKVGAQVDTSVHDLRRMVKIFGTAKPEVGVRSIWYGGQRTEDEALRSYLIGMVMEPEQEQATSSRPLYGPQLLHANGDLPPLFLNLLRQDARLNAYWHGRGKTNGDGSRTGYDFSVVRRLLVLGYRDIDDLATVLSVRPDGAVKQAQRGENYVRRTIANALLK